MSQNFYNSLALALLGPQANPNNPSTALSPQLLYAHKGLVDIVADSAKAFRSADAKMAIAELQTQVKVYSQAQKSLVDITEQLAKNSRVSSQNRMQIRKAALQETTKLKSRLDDHDEDKLIELKNSARDINRNSGMPPKKALLYAATQTTFPSKDLLDPDNTRIFGTVNKVLGESVGATLSDPNIIQKVEALFADDPARGSGVINFIRTQKLNYERVDKQLTNVEALIAADTKYDKAARDLIDRKISAGTPEGREAYRQLNDEYGRVLKEVVPTLLASGDDADLIIERNKKYLKAFEEDIATYLPVIQQYEKLITGKSGVNNLQGEAISTPGFKAWAKDNGFDNLGFIKDGVYIKGADDVQALMMFNYQRKNPEKYRPGLFNRDGDTDDVIVLEAAPSQKYLDSLVSYSDPKDGNKLKYVMKLDKDGNKRYIKKDDDLMLLAAKGGYRIDTVDNETLIVDFRAGDIFDESSTLYEALAEEARKPDSGFTIEQIQNAVKDNPEDMSQTLADTALKDKDGKLNPRMLKALGVVKVDVDGNVISLSLDEVADAVAEEPGLAKDGKTREVKKPTLKGNIPPNSLNVFFNDDEAGTKGIASAVSATEEPPTEKRYARRKRLHAANDFGPDGVSFRAETTSGTITYALNEDPEDKGFKVVASYDQSDVGKAGLLDPQKATEEIERKRFGISPDELKSETLFKSGETDEGQKDREGQTVIEALYELPGVTARRGMRTDRKINDILDELGPGFVLDDIGTPEYASIKDRRAADRSLREETAQKRLSQVERELGITPQSTLDLTPGPESDPQFGTFMGTGRFYDKERADRMIRETERLINIGEKLTELGRSDEATPYFTAAREMAALGAKQTGGTLPGRMQRRLGRVLPREGRLPPQLTPFDSDALTPTTSPRLKVFEAPPNMIGSPDLGTPLPGQPVPEVYVGEEGGDDEFMRPTQVTGTTIDKAAERQKLAEAAKRLKETAKKAQKPGGLEPSDATTRTIFRKTADPSVFAEDYDQ